MFEMLLPSPGHAQIQNVRFAVDHLTLELNPTSVEGSIWVDWMHWVSALGPSPLVVLKMLKPFSQRVEDSYLLCTPNHVALQ